MTSAVVADGFVLRSLARIGRIAIFFGQVLVQCGKVLARPDLVITRSTMPAAVRW